MGNLTDVTEATFAAEVEQSSTPVLVDFWAEWCGPCRAMGPVLEQFAQEQSGRVKVVKVDVDANPELQNRFRIMSIPTMLLFDGGQPAKQLVGAMPKPRLESELSEWVGATA